MYNRYCKLRDELGIKDATVANATGITKSTFSDWKSGRSVPKREKLQKISDYFGVSLDYLMTGREEIELRKFDNIFSIDLKKYPLLGEIACGEPIFANEDRESYILSGTNINADFCLRAKGDSMINARILDGDIVFIKKQDTVENGEIAAVIIDDEVLLKRMYFDSKSGVVTLSSENPAYPPKIFSGETLNHIRVLGKAIAFQSDVI